MSEASPLVNALRQTMEAMKQDPPLPIAFVTSIKVKEQLKGRFHVVSAPMIAPLLKVVALTHAARILEGEELGVKVTDRSILYGFCKLDEAMSRQPEFFEGMDREKLMVFVAEYAELYYLKSEIGILLQIDIPNEGEKDE